MSRWLDRPGYVTVIAFAGGAAIAAFAVLLVVFLRDGGDDGGGPEPQVIATGTPAAPTSTPAAAVATPTALATPAAGFPDPDEALAAFVHDQLQSTYIGACPSSVAPDEELPDGYCSIELYRSAELVTFNVGRFGTEALGEAVVIPDAEGTWSLTFLVFPALDAQIATGADAMVFQAQDCLRFRTAPSTSADVSSCQIDGTQSLVVEGPVEAEDITWWRLEGLGWASSQYLAPVAN